MKAAIFLSIILGVNLVCAGSDNVVWSIKSIMPDGTSVDAKVLEHDLQKAPRWNDLEKDPPLAPKIAIKKAREFAEQFKGEGLKVVVGDVTLKSLGGDYVYVVQVFLYPANGKMDGFSPPMNIVILMDGTLVKFTAIPR